MVAVMLKKSTSPFQKIQKMEALQENYQTITHSS